MNHIKALPSIILLATLLLGPTVLAVYVTQGQSEGLRMAVTGVMGCVAVVSVPWVADVVDWAEGMWT